jgi:hypothetical protein
MEQYRKEFQDDVTWVKENLEKTLSKLGRIQQQVGYEWAQLRQGSKADVQKDSSRSEL